MSGIPTHQILLLEDDLELADLVNQFLTAKGCQVTHAENGAEFMKALHHRHYDLIISDVVLPDASGFQLLEQCKAQINCPLIFLSALSAVDDQVNGLELGAHDYMVKPVAPELLWAKVQVAIRQARRPESTARRIDVGALEIDLTSRSARVANDELKLTDNEFDLLVIFAEQPTQLLSREYLFRRVVGREFDGLDRVVDMRVSRLRKKLDSMANGVIIRSIRGRGYSLHAADQAS